MNKYSDIINLSRPKSKYKSMTLEERAAIFSPFAALKGYDDNISDVSRFVDEKIILDDEKRELINARLQIINTNIKDKPLVSLTYFIKDKNKNGGVYSNYQGNLKKIDVLNQKIIFIDGFSVSINDIIDIY